MLTIKYEYPARALLDKPKTRPDGDTFWAYLDRGDRDYSERRIRLGHLNAEPLHTVLGDEAWAYVRNWLEEAARGALKWPLMIEIVEYDKYNGRMVGVVRRRCDGRVLNDDLIAHGLAHPYEGRGDKGE